MISILKQSFMLPIFATTVLIILSTTAQNIEFIYSQYTPYLKFIQENRYFLEKNQQPQEKVEIRLYYECLCKDCRNFDTTRLISTVEKLGKYLDLYLYPYGNAKTITHPDGTYEITCQHGPAECYGNKLHACAIDYFANNTAAIFFNSCMMDYSRTDKGSDDNAADTCGAMMNVDSEQIKLCARSPRGLALLKFYGDESHKVSYKGVPYILINGVQSDGDYFMRDVCAAFTVPPPECLE